MLLNKPVHARSQRNANLKEAQMIAECLRFASESAADLKSHAHINYDENRDGDQVTVS